MKKHLALLFLSSFILEHAQANILNTTFTVPFQNITLKPHGQLTANYSFGTHAIIFCFNNNTTTQGTINWIFNQSLRSSTLPVFLKTKANFEGEFADAIGILTIGNNLNTPLVVGCLFGF